MEIQSNNFFLKFANKSTIFFSIFNNLCTFAVAYAHFFVLKKHPPNKLKRT